MQRANMHVFILLLAILISWQVNRPQTRTDEEPLPLSRYIVRFKEYAQADDIHKELTGVLPDDGSWEWVGRSNPASEYTTDFALVDTSRPILHLTAALQHGSPTFKDIHIERKLTQGLLMKNTENFRIESQSDQIIKKPGRLSGKFSIEASVKEAFSRQLLVDEDSLPYRLDAVHLWERGYKGDGVKMGVFDTGVRLDHPHIKNITERSNWTHEPTLDDGLGHGSFVAGVIAGTNGRCPGIAPSVLLHTFRVFTNDQVSYTSWFLDAFNYALATKMNIVNLSIGGPDYLDVPFVDKVLEITSNGIIMVSAIGNDGPLYGTLNNPGDQSDVIGVGGIDFEDSIAHFSSRGMTTWELPVGYGRAKPDVMAYGDNVPGSRIDGGCRHLSGTSVASPVVAGVVCLLASVVPEAKRWNILNPASMKQALVEGSIRLPGYNMYEQGQGKMNAVESMKLLEVYEPRASVVPKELNLTDCPYMWPHCAQPLYAGGMPVMFNATVLNGMGVTGRFASTPIFTPNQEDGGAFLDIRFEYSDVLWPWSGYLALYIHVRSQGAKYQGIASGVIEFTIISPPALGEASNERSSTITFPLVAAIIPTPPREQRILWDQFHSLRYPPAYIPRDNLGIKHDVLDWHGDHPHTNYHDAFNRLIDNGYYVELLASPATCFQADEYVALLIVDPEDEWYPEEVAKLENDVKNKGLSLIIFADWYDLPQIENLRFYDDNTRSWWEGATGGANVPALNDLLKPYNVALKGGAVTGWIDLLPVQKFSMESGSVLAAWPAGGYIYNITSSPRGKHTAVVDQPVLGVAKQGSGHLIVYGDSNCLDSSHQTNDCYDFLIELLKIGAGHQSELLTGYEPLQERYGSLDDDLPVRRADYNFTPISFVLRHELRCYLNTPLNMHDQGLQQQQEEDAVPEKRAVAVDGSDFETKLEEKKQTVMESTEREDSTIEVLEGEEDKLEAPTAYTDIETRFKEEEPREMESRKGEDTTIEALEGEEDKLEAPTDLSVDSAKELPEWGGNGQQQQGSLALHTEISLVLLVIGGIAITTLAVFRKRRARSSIMLPLYNSIPFVTWQNRVKGEERAD